MVSCLRSIWTNACRRSASAASRFLGGLDGVLQPGDVALYLLHLRLDAELFVLALALDFAGEVFEVLFEASDFPLSLVEFGL